MIASTINFSQLEDRIDAEYFKPEYTEIEKLLSSAPLLRESVKLSKRRVDPGRNPTENFCYLEIYNVDLKTGWVEPQMVVGRDAPSRARKAVELGDSIVSTVRPNRNAVGFITKELKYCIVSTGFAVLHPIKILPGYLFAFLKSKFASKPLTRLTGAAMYPAVFESDILNLRLSIPPQSFQQHIEELVKKTHQKRKQAEKKYREAERLLEEELGLEDLDLSTQKTFEAKFSKISDRIDSDYYQPRFIRIKELLLREKYKTVTIGEISREIKYGTSEKVYYTNDGVPFLRVTDIDSFYTIWPEEGKFISPYETERLKEYKTNEGDLIISRTGTLGSAIYIDKSLKDCIFGSYFIKVTLNHPELDPFFVAFFLNSKAGKLQSERLGSGGIQTNLTIDAIKSLIVPILPKSAQQKISKLIQQSFNLRQESKALIEKAKKEVEEMIEKAGE